MKKIRILVWVLFFIAVLFIFTKSSPAMNDPELIQWRATTFNTFVSSAYQAVFGRLPNQNDWNFARQYRQKLRLFWALIGSQEYRNRYGYLTKKYFVYWKTRPIDTINGRKLCHCYYYAEFSGGYMPSMQYTGVSIPPGKLTKDVARSLVLACAAFDKRTCPHYDCGFTGASIPNNSGNRNNNETRNQGQNNNFTTNQGNITKIKKNNWVGTWAVNSLHKAGPSRGGRFSSRFTIIQNSSGSYIIWNNTKMKCTIYRNTLRFNGKHPSGGKMNWTFVRNGNVLISSQSTFRGMIRGKSAWGIYEGRKVSN